MNVMFVLMDDFRLQMGGDAAFRVGGAATTEMHTPSLDSLRESSVFFPKAQVQIALCGPSRASMLTGRRPDTNKVWDLHSYWRDQTRGVAGRNNFTTIPQYVRSLQQQAHAAKCTPNRWKPLSGVSGMSCQLRRRAAPTPREACVDECGESNPTRVSVAPPVPCEYY